MRVSQLQLMLFGFGLLGLRIKNLDQLAKSGHLLVSFYLIELFLDHEFFAHQQSIG